MSRFTESWQRWTAYLAGTLLVLCAFVLPISTSATSIIFPLAIVLSLISAKWRELGAKLMHWPVASSLVIFFGLFLLGSIYTVAPVHDVLHRLTQMVCLLLSAFLMASVTNHRIRTYMVNAFLFAMVITLIGSYTKYYILHSPPIDRFDIGNVFKDHIVQSFLMVIALFIFIYRWLHKFRYRWLYAVLIVLTTYNVILMSEGRSGYFIFAALLLYTGLVYFKWRGVLVALAIIGTLGASSYWGSDAFKSRLVSIKENTQAYQQGKGYTSVGIRLQSIKNAYDLFLEKPWLGYGTGSFASVYAALPANMIGDAGPVPLSYNNYLNVAVELGVVGVGFLLFMFLLQWRYSFYLTSEWRYYTQVLLISMVLGCMANPWLSDTTELHFYALFIAIGFSTLADKKFFVREPMTSAVIATD